MRAPIIGAYFWHARENFTKSAPLSHPTPRYKGFKRGAVKKNGKRGLFLTCSGATFLQALFHPFYPLFCSIFHLKGLLFDMEGLIFDTAETSWHTHRVSLHSAAEIHPDGFAVTREAHGRKTQRAASPYICGCVSLRLRERWPTFAAASTDAARLWLYC